MHRAKYVEMKLSKNKKRFTFENVNALTHPWKNMIFALFSKCLEDFMPKVSTPANRNNNKFYLFVLHVRTQNACIHFPHLNSIFFLQ